MAGIAPESAQKAVANALLRRSDVKEETGHVQDNGISLFLSESPDLTVSRYIADLQGSVDNTDNSAHEHIDNNYKKYNIDPKSTHESLYVHNSLINEGKINLEKANKLLGCPNIVKQENEKVTMSEKANCSVMGGRKSRKQRRSKRRRRRGRQSRK